MNYKFKKKPTIKEVAGVTIELGQRVTSLMHFVSELEKAFSVYVEMKGDIENFKNYIDEQYKKLKEENDDAKRNGDADKPNLQGDTDGESSGSEGIREKE